MESTPLWAASAERCRKSHMQTFLDHCYESQKISERNYDRLYQWSIDRPHEFWNDVAAYTNLQWQENPREIYQPSADGRMRGGKWFPGGKLNFAKNLMPEPSDEVVITSYAEGRSELIHITSAQLWDMVSRCAAALKQSGVVAGDRVAAVIGNTPEAVIGMLATTSLGAVWSSCSPDFGVAGIVDRFSQIDPKICFMTAKYSYGGKIFDVTERLDELQEKLPQVAKWVTIDHLPPNNSGGIDASEPWDRFLTQQSSDPALSLTFVPTDFDHPVYILYSSGTTGVPKCIVHGAGGTLLQHKKELMLHTDLQHGDRLLYFTTCGWMMWNWMVSALACGGRLVLFEGSIAHPQTDALWQFAKAQEVNILGLSPKYIQGCMNEKVQLPQWPHLKSILSTGSPLLDEHYEWIYEAFGDQVHLASISGGTDIISCFMLGNPLKPVFKGQIQGPGLGMSVEVWDGEGKPLKQGRGELVCTQPFPSMPVGFWGDDSGERYQDAYFSHYPHKDVWRHGDYIEQTPSGGIIVHGRSDATLNPGGVRIGSAEIYRRVEMMDCVADSLVVGLPLDGDVAVLLFVKLGEGVSWSHSLSAEIKKQIRKHLTPRHVPRLVFPVADIPYTRSGKKVEIAVQRVLQGFEVPNAEALLNPQSLKIFAQLQDQIRKELNGS